MELLLTEVKSHQPRCASKAPDVRLWRPTNQGLIKSILIEICLVILFKSHSQLSITKGLNQNVVSTHNATAILLGPLAGKRINPGTDWYPIRQQQAPTISRTMSSEEHLRRSAVAMSNAGVGLMRMGCHQHAYETMREALLIAKTAYDPVSANDCALRFKVDDKVHRAARRLSKPTATKTTFPVHVLSDSDPSFDPFARCGTVLQPILIEHVDSDPDLVSSCIVYNFAVAHLALASCKSPILAAKLRRSAVTLLQLASSSLCSLLQCEPDDIEAERIVLVATIVLSTLYPILQTLGNLAKAEICLSRIAMLRSTIDEFRSCEPAVGQASAAAA